MSDRDELARDIDPGAYEPPFGNDPRNISEAAKRKYNAEKIADVLWSAGWRKKPSREELRKVFMLAYARAPREKVTMPAQLCPDDYDGSTVEATSINMEPILDAILALLDGPTETGEK